MANASAHPQHNSGSPEAKKQKNKKKNPENGIN